MRDGDGQSALPFHDSPDNAPNYTLRRIQRERFHLATQPLTGFAWRQLETSTVPRPSRDHAGLGENLSLAIRIDRENGGIRSGWAAR